MRVNDIMTRDPHIITPDVTLDEAARAMRDHDCGYLPVGENDRLTGALTDRDIVIRAVAEGRALENTKVKDIMTPKIQYCFEDATLEEAAKLMEKHKIRRLAVLNSDKRLTGILSISDIAVNNKKLAGTIESELIRHAA